MTPGYDLLASGLLLGGSSVALALTALAARRARRDRRRAEFAANNARAANAASLDRLFTAAGITVTAPETVDVIPIPVPPLKLYAEVEGVPGSVVAADDAADAGDVIEFGKFFQEFGGEAGA